MCHSSWKPDWRGNPVRVGISEPKPPPAHLTFPTKNGPHMQKKSASAERVVAIPMVCHDPGKRPNETLGK